MGHQTGAVSTPVYYFINLLVGFFWIQTSFCFIKWLFFTALYRYTSNILQFQVTHKSEVPPNWNTLKTNQTTTSPFASHKWIASVRHLAKLLTPFHTQEELLNKSSWVDRVPNSRKEICQSNYRNDDQKYDLNILGNINHL